MKILEAQSAVLTNYEVFEHLKAQNERRWQLKKDVRMRLQREARDKKVAAGGRGDLDATERKTIEQTVKDITRRPGNLETVVRELLDYLKEAPSPLGSQPFPYNENSIRALLESLRPYDLTKAEILMIMNLRPTNLTNLNTLIEEMDLRFPSEEQQQEMVRIIADVLGKPDSEANRQAMTENREARKEQSEWATQEGVVDEDMEVDGPS